MVMNLKVKFWLFQFLTVVYFLQIGAVHAHYAIVFARLIHEGVDEGLHGFLVNIRDENNLKVKDGCRVWEMGYKIGLNGK